MKIPFLMLVEVVIPPKISACYVQCQCLFFSTSHHTSSLQPPTRESRLKKNEEEEPMINLKRTLNLISWIIPCTCTHTRRIHKSLALSILTMSSTHNTTPSSLVLVLLFSLFHLQISIIEALDMPVGGPINK
jgi:hypothetical protein